LKVFTRAMLRSFGELAAIPDHIEINSSQVLQLSVEDPDVWKSNHFLISESIIEIIAVDSRYTIIKFKDKTLSEKFKNYFQDQAVDLHIFNEKHFG
jgi:hypothetical protein